MVLRGPNGIDKTTLLHDRATGTPLAGRDQLPAEDIAYAGHADGIKATLSVTVPLRFWARIFGTEDIAPALAAMDLEDPSPSRRAQPFGGARRRLGLARLRADAACNWTEPTVCA